MKRRNFWQRMSLWQRIALLTLIALGVVFAIAVTINVFVVGQSPREANTYQLKSGVPQSLQFESCNGLSDHVVNLNRILPDGQVIINGLPQKNGDRYMVLSSKCKVIYDIGYVSVEGTVVKLHREKPKIVPFTKNTTVPDVTLTEDSIISTKVGFDPTRNSSMVVDFGLLNSVYTTKTTCLRQGVPYKETIELRNQRAPFRRIQQVEISVLTRHAQANDVISLFISFANGEWGIAPLAVVTGNFSSECTEIKVLDISSGPTYILTDQTPLILEP